MKDEVSIKVSDENGNCNKLWVLPRKTFDELKEKYGESFGTKPLIMYNESKK